MNNDLPTNITYEYSEPFPILQPAYHDLEIYKRLTDKVYKTIRDVFLRYSDYDWYLKADDDTFVFVDNLKLFLETKSTLKPVTYGFDYKVIVDYGYHSGGAGYVFSNEAFKRIGLKLATNFTFCSDSGIEDVDIANCLRKLGVYPGKSIDDEGRERFHPFNIKNHVQGRYPSGFLEYSRNNIKPVSL